MSNRIHRAEVTADDTKTWSLEQIAGELAPLGRALEAFAGAIEGEDGEVDLGVLRFVLRLVRATSYVIGRIEGGDSRERPEEARQALREIHFEGFVLPVLELALVTTLEDPDQTCANMPADPAWRLCEWVATDVGRRLVAWAEKHEA